MTEGEDRPWRRAAEPETLRQNRGRGSTRIVARAGDTRHVREFPSQVVEVAGQIKIPGALGVGGVPEYDIEGIRRPSTHFELLGIPEGGEEKKQSLHGAGLSHERAFGQRDPEFYFCGDP